MGSAPPKQQVTPGEWTHRKSGKIVSVVGAVLLQDDLDSSGAQGGVFRPAHGPYDGQEWTLYVHDGKTFCRKPGAFLSKFDPKPPHAAPAGWQEITSVSAPPINVDILTYAEATGVVVRRLCLVEGPTRGQYVPAWYRDVSVYDEAADQYPPTHWAPLPPLPGR